jgi:hypothetical protein
MPISVSAIVRVVDPTALYADTDFGMRYTIRSLAGRAGTGGVYKLPSARTGLFGGQGAAIVTEY